MKGRDSSLDLEKKRVLVKEEKKRGPLNHCMLMKNVLLTKRDYRDSSKRKKDSNRKKPRLRDFLKRGEIPLWEKGGVFQKRGGGEFQLFLGISRKPGVICPKEERH